MGPALKLMAAEWELYFGMSLAEFDHEINIMFSKNATINRLATKFLED
jgi:hypothetical protein